MCKLHKEQLKELKQESVYILTIVLFKSNNDFCAHLCKNDPYSRSVFLFYIKIEFQLSFVIHSNLYFDNSTPVLFRQTFCRTKTHLMSIFWHEFLWIFAGKKNSLGRDQTNGTCREHVCGPILCGDTFYYCWLSCKILSNTYPRMRRCM